MADQRLIGLRLEQLYEMALSGDPGRANQVGQRLIRASAALDQASSSLDRAANQLGLGWEGRAADAAHTGIAGHAHWARTAGTQTSVVGNNAQSHASSATYVRENMPDPKLLPSASGSAGSPIGTDLARADDARRNATLRAVELLEGHAAKSETGRPSGTFEPAPTAGTGAAGAQSGRSTPGARQVSGRVTGPAATGGGPTASGRAAGHSAAAPPVSAQRGAGARDGAPTTPSAVARRGAVVPVGSDVRRGGGVLRGPDVPRDAGVGLGLRAGPGLAYGGEVRGPDRLPAPEVAHKLAPRGDESHPRGPGHGSGVSAQVSLGVAEGPRGHGGPDGADGPGVAGGPMTGFGALTAGVGGAAQRLDFLIDNDSMFDGGFSNNEEWVSPPVIGT